MNWMSGVWSCNCLVVGALQELPLTRERRITSTVLQFDHSQATNYVWSEPAVCVTMVKQQRFSVCFRASILPIIVTPKLVDDERFLSKEITLNVGVRRRDANPTQNYTECWNLQRRWLGILQKPNERLETLYRRFRPFFLCQFMPRVMTITLN